MVDKIWICSEEETDVCKGAGCDNPGHALWVGEEGIAEGEDGGFDGDGWGGGCGKEVGAIETGDAWRVLGTILGIEDNDIGRIGRGRRVKRTPDDEGRRAAPDKM